MSQSAQIVVGVDVGGKRKGFHAVALRIPTNLLAHSGTVLAQPGVAAQPGHLQQFLPRACQIKSAAHS